MVLNTLPTEIIVDRETLTHLYLDGEPQPGAYLDIEGQTYLVLERRHRYRLEWGQYRLDRIVLYVQKSQVSLERSLWDGHWVLGDVTCRFNARSPLLRCAVNPDGPCDHCMNYQALLAPS